MQRAKTYLELLCERGKKGLPLERVYRQLFNQDLYLMAYGKIYQNKGAMTPGVTGETPDGMSLDKIQTIIEALRYERYQWRPARRTYILKKNGKKRPLGMPVWSDKLVQEVLRLMLEAYFEPQMSDHSHGFRPKRGCHTALQEIYHNWTGTTWFIEGDISQCFDKLDHTLLLEILSEHIHDGRFLHLISELLEAGYLEEWRLNQTLSGVPQGGILSPILSNILLDKLDKYVEAVLIPQYSRGTRQPNSEYVKLMNQSQRERKKGDALRANQLRKQAQKLPSFDPKDATYRRLKYVRYADDFLLGFVGPRSEAEEIKQLIGTYLRDKLKLELSESKTLITHARSEAARFLGYEVTIYQENRKRTLRDTNRHGTKTKCRNINGRIGFRVPADVLREKSKRYQDGKIIRHRPEISHASAYEIVMTYQLEFRGIVNYYCYAYNMRNLGKLKRTMEISLTKTLAHKFKVSVSKIYHKYRADLLIGEKTYKGLKVIIPRTDKHPLVATWGGIPLMWDIKATLEDHPSKVYGNRTGLERRLLANICELCGNTDHIEVHHIRAMKDVHQYPGREKPDWVIRMSALKRKTMILCRTCHDDLHAGRPLRRQIIKLADVQARQKAEVRRY